jgi:hypothetical protein
MTRRGRERPGPGGRWLLLVPGACCGGPLLVAGLAAAGVLAWGGLGLALAVLLAGAMLVIRSRRRACAAGNGSRRPREVRAGQSRGSGTMTSP